MLGSRPAVLDGEIVALDDEGRGDFQRLQPRMGLVGSPARAARMAAKAPVHLMLFDVVFLDTVSSPAPRTPSAAPSWNPWTWAGSRGRLRRRSSGTVSGRWR